MEVAALYADRSQWPVFSAETFPTENFRPIDAVLKTVEELLPHDVKVVTTTWGALGSARGGTPSVCRIIHERFNVPTVVHFSIQAKTRRDVEGLLRGLHLDGLHNILALGGDPPAGVVDYVPRELRHRYASDLVQQLVAMNNGLWMDPEGKYTRTGVKTHFGIGVAGFPEIHPDDWRADESLASNMQRNVDHLKIKVDGGAHYIVEQMIFDADFHFRYEEACRAAGITLPIVPGILPFDRVAQASRFCSDDLRISMPPAIRSKLQAASEEDQEKIGAEYMAAQVQRLLDAGVPGIHFYCMNRSGPTIALLDRLRLQTR
jgi:methylenetetrahydrofolate reductase (NADPH)